MMVPLLMASSMGKSVSPGTLKLMLKDALQKSTRKTYPTILNGLSPALTVLTDTNDDIETVVTSVQALTMALRAVANESERVVLKVILKLSQRPVTALIDGLLDTGKVKSLDTTDTLHDCEYC